MESLGVRRLPKTDSSGAALVAEALCESVRIDLFTASILARAHSGFVNRVTGRSRVLGFLESLRGWRSQERGGSNPPFRSNINC